MNKNHNANLNDTFGLIESATNAIKETLIDQVPEGIGDFPLKLNDTLAFYINDKDLRVTNLQTNDDVSFTALNLNEQKSFVKVFNDNINNTINKFLNAEAVHIIDRISELEKDAYKVFSKSIWIKVKILYKKKYGEWKDDDELSVNSLENPARLMAAGTTIFCFDVKGFIWTDNLMRVKGNIVDFVTKQIYASDITIPIDDCDAKLLAYIDDVLHDNILLQEED